MANLNVADPAWSAKSRGQKAKLAGSNAVCLHDLELHEPSLSSSKLLPTSLCIHLSKPTPRMLEDPKFTLSVG